MVNPAFSRNGLSTSIGTCAANVVWTDGIRGRFAHVPRFEKFVRKSARTLFAPHLVGGLRFSRMLEISPTRPFPLTSKIKLKKTRNKTRFVSKLKRKVPSYFAFISIFAFSFERILYAKQNRALNKFNACLFSISNAHPSSLFIHPVSSPLAPLTSGTRSFV